MSFREQRERVGHPTSNAIQISMKTHLPSILSPVLALGLTVPGFPKVRAADVVVKMTGSLTFSPSASTINAGDSVTWTNITSTQHNTTSTTKLWASSTSGLGLTFTHQFTNSGSFPYECTLHVNEGMTGKITVNAVAAPPSLGSANFVTPTNFEFSISIPTGAQYAVDRTFDFSTWLALATNAAVSTPVTFTDAVVTNRSFYRVRLLP